MAKKINRKKKIIDLFNIQSGFCCYCDTKMTLKLNKHNTATIDHIKPKSKGGTNHIYNLAASCQKCNLEKGNLEINEWMQIVNYKKSKKYDRA